jgi:hypothetical protein
MQIQIKPAHHVEQAARSWASRRKRWWYGSGIGSIGFFRGSVSKKRPHPNRASTWVTRMDTSAD